MTATNALGAAGAQPTLDVSITAPDEAEVGEDVTVDAVVSVSGHDGEVEAAVTFAVGETVLAERTVTIDGSAILTFEHVFSSGGERTLAVVAGAVVDSEEIQGAASHTIAVTGGDQSEVDDRIEADDRAAVSRSLIEEGGWEVTDQTSQRVFEEEQGPLTVTGDAYTTIYEDAVLRSDVAERTLGNVDAPLFIFFTTWIDFSHALSDLPREASEVLAEVEADAKERFVDQLEGQGLTDVSEAGTGTVSIATGETATVTDYEATYAVSDMSVALPGDRELVIEGDGVTIEGLVAAWHDGRDAFVAGGAYPASNYQQTIKRTITEAIDLTVEIDLGLEPAAYEEELIALVQSVS